MRFLPWKPLLPPASQRNSNFEHRSATAVWRLSVSQYIWRAQSLMRKLYSFGAYKNKTKSLILLAPAKAFSKYHFAPSPYPFFTNNQVPLSQNALRLSLSVSRSLARFLVGAFRGTLIMEQQKNQKTVQEQHDEVEEIQHGPFPVEQLQVLPTSHFLLLLILRIFMSVFRHQSWALSKIWVFFMGLIFYLLVRNKRKGLYFVVGFRE